MGVVDPGHDRAMLLRTVGFGVCVLVGLAAAGLLWRERMQAEATLDGAQLALASYEDSSKGLPLDPVQDADLPRIVPLLDHARALPYGYEHVADEAGGTIEYELVGRRGAGATARQISLASPVGQALAGARGGDVAHVTLPNGRARVLQVLDVRESGEATTRAA